MTANKLSSSQSSLLFFSLGLASFLLMMDFSIANLAVPYIAGSLSVSTNMGTYAITWFAVGNAIGLAMTGHLAKKYGPVNLIIMSILGFTFSSFLCGLSFDLNMLVVVRLIQGLTGGPIVPLCQTLILEYSAKENLSKNLSGWAMIVVTGPISGYLIGGFITYWYSWPWIFFINIPFGFFCSLAIWFAMREIEKKREKTSSDIPGMILLIAGVTALQIFLDKGQEWDWFDSHLIWLLTIIFILSFAYLIIHEVWNPHPFLNLRLFSLPSYTLSIFCLIFSYSIYFGTLFLIPLWMQEYMGYNALKAGIVGSWVGLAPPLLAGLAPRISKRLSNLKVLAISISIFGIVCLLQSYIFTTDVTDYYISLMRFIYGLGIIFYISPLLSISTEGIPEEQIPNAMGIFHCIRALSGAIGTSVCKTIWERRTIYHHETLGSRITELNSLAAQFKTEESTFILNKLVDDQSALLAMNDLFYLIGFCNLILAFLIYCWSLLKKRKETASLKHSLISEG